MGDNTRARARPHHQGVAPAGGGGDGPRNRGARRLRLRLGQAWEDLGRFTDQRDAGARRTADDHQVRHLRLVGAALGAGDARPGERGALAGPPHRLGRAGRGAEELPRRLLGARRRRARRRRRAAAGGPLRPLPRAAGERPRRGPGDPGEGADRPRLRRPHLLGHRGLRAAVALLRRPGGGGRGAEVAAGDDRQGARAGEGALPRGRRLPLADDQRRRDRRLLARRHRRLPHQRRHRPGGLPLLRHQRRPRLRARRRPAAAGRNGAALAQPRPPRRPRRLPHRRGHRPRRVLGDRRQQRLHQPDGAEEPGRRRRVRRALRRRRRGARGRPRGDRLLARRGEGDDDPLRRGARTSTRRRTTSPSTPAGTSPGPGPTTTRCCSTTPTSTSTASRW